ncbi:ESF1 homolog [Megalobrama amblycephala]|uniref:ESF1 homolog n=1 Tax=Megalobrama amblycephala TaxID=75352 RepID=UPI00201453AF|nr:ESF1 homolog [Megalobrama amblycephala]XP_048052181.1 ESF1 homolog [Megalobrama amblycephala]
MTSKNTVSGDDRFSKVKKDPRFWEMPNRERKVKIDKRFQSMFHDERFQLKYTVDKRGRPINHSSREDLKRFYKLSDSEQSDEEEDDEKTEETERKKKEADEEPQDESDESEEEEEAKKTKELPIKGVRVFEEDEDEKSDVEEDDEDGSTEGDDDEDDDEEEDEDDEENDSELDEDSDNGPDLARGKGNIETSSDEDEDDDDDDVKLEEEEIEHDWGEMWKDAPRSDNTSRRLAVCNMNWDRLKAKDLLALFNSFKPKGGVVLSVTIYPSEFGKERMSAEQTQGPLELASLPEDPEADTEEQRIYREKVRDYQFKRLRYYYAVLECDSVETAAKIYEECDGFEYESSCSTIDLRFIPDDVTFDDEPKDRATDVDYGSYKPKLFTSTGTTTAKVDLTWDETDHDRVTALCRKFNKDELLDMDFKAYLASSSEEEEEEEEEAEKQTEAEKPAQPLPEEKKGSKGKKSTEQIAKYRDLLKSIQDKEKEKEDNMDMEITWVPGLKETTEKLVKKKMMGTDVLTPWQEYLQKKKEKKKEKRKGKKEAMEAEPVISDDELPADVDLNDPFFSEELGAAAPLKNKKNKKNRKKDEEKTPEEQEELKRQRAEMELLMDDDEDGKHKHFNYDKIVEHQNLSKQKRKKLLKSNTPLEDDDFQVDVQDPRFQAMFTSHLYNLDPSDPAYKKTKASQIIFEEKLRRREEHHSQDETPKSKATQEKLEPETSSTTKVMDSNLSLLIKSIKNKTQQFQARKKQKTK